MYSNFYIEFLKSILKKIDIFIFINTGSNFRAGIDVSNLKLSKGNNTYIDIWENYIDISASSVFINNQKIFFKFIIIYEFQL